MLIERLRKEWRVCERILPIDYAPRFTRDGLVMGAGTVLAPASADRCLQNLAGQEMRLLTLLSAAYGRVVPSSALSAVGRAKKRWEDREDCLALIHLALAGLTEPEDRREAARRLFMADGLIKAGIAPEAILQALGDDDDAFVRYASSEPRVPGGNGRESGEWTKGDGVLRGLTKAAEQFLKKMAAARLAEGLGDLAANPYLLAAGLILIPKTIGHRVEGDVTEIPGLSYTWDSDTTDLRLTYAGPNVLRNFHAMLGYDGQFHDGDRIVARRLSDGTVAIDPAEISSDLADKDGPNLCPTPAPDKFGRGEEKGAKDKDYEDQIKLLINPDNPTPRGYGYKFLDPDRNAWVVLDDCQHRTGMRVEVKGEYDGLFTFEKGEEKITKDWLNQSSRQLNVSKGFELSWIFARQSDADFASGIFREGENGQQRIKVQSIPRLGSRQ